MSDLAAIRDGYISKYVLGKVRSDGTPIQQLREALMVGLLQKIELYRQLVGSEMEFGNQGKYPRLITEAEQVLDALYAGKKFTFEGIEIPAE